MTLSWWDIPGPSRFVRRVANDLRDRLNVVAALPENVADSWFSYFRRNCQRDQFRLEVIQAILNSRNPVDILCNEFTTMPAGFLTVGMVATEPSFAGRTIAVFLDDSTQAKVWFEFLGAYERECRGIDELNRTVFLVTVDGISPKLFPQPETCLRVHRYDGYARTQDCYMYSWVLMGAEENQPWQTEMKIALCAQLAQWDARICEVLSERNLTDIICRETIKSTFQLPREDIDLTNLDESWARGIQQKVDGKSIYHSGWVANDPTSTEFERRVWTAQLQVMYPLLEKVRRQLIDHYRHTIRLPVLTGDNEVVTDPYELEIKMVRKLLYQAGGIPKKVLRHLDLSLDFRNSLAHLEALSADKLLQFNVDLQDTMGKGK